jgi:hypothetical protein
METRTRKERVHENMSTTPSSTRQGVSHVGENYLHSVVELATHGETSHAAHRLTVGGHGATRELLLAHCLRECFDWDWLPRSSQSQPIDRYMSSTGPTMGDWRPLHRFDHISRGETAQFLIPSGATRSRSGPVRSSHCVNLLISNPSRSHM